MSQECIVVVYGHSVDILSTNLPYGRNLLQEEIFANLAILLSEEIFAIFRFNY